MALYRNGAFCGDDWVLVENAAPLPEAGPVAVTKERWQTEHESLLARDTPLGLVLTAGENLDGITGALAHFSLIVLRFPKFSDGRPYSLARLLRDRYGYKGELRAAGDVLRDQIGFLARAGFDAFEVSHPGTIAALAEGRVHRFRHHYQPSSAPTDEVRPGPRPWLRVSPAAGAPS